MRLGAKSMARAKAVCRDAFIADTLHHALQRSMNRSTRLGNHVIVEMDVEELEHWLREYEWDTKKLGISIKAA